MLARGNERAALLQDGCVDKLGSNVAMELYFCNLTMLVVMLRLQLAEAQASGLMSAFNLPEDAVACFLREIENGYMDNPYHSSTHAAGVLQMMHMLMQHGLIQSGVMDQNMQLASYFAGSVQHESFAVFPPLLSC